MSIRRWQAALGPLLVPLARGYSRLMAERAQNYANGGAGLLGALAGRFTSYRPSVPCISVGNISWGGTGKTPLVRWLGEWFLAQSFKPVILTRGYGGRPARLPMAVNARSLPEESGDEPLLLAQAGLSVVVDPKRARSAAWAEERLAPDVLLMDDGFQHLALARDLDLVILTPHDLGDGWGKVLPAGTWREGPDALKRASAFLIHAEPETFDDLQRDIALTLLPLEKPVFAFHLRAKGLRLVGRYTPLPKREDPEDAADAPKSYAAPEVDSQSGLAPDLAEAPYALVSGVGSPERVTATATEFFGYPPAEELRFPDHHPYSASDAARIKAVRERGLEIVCTAKDAVKLAESSEQAGFPLWGLEAEPVFQQSIEGLIWEHWLSDIWTELRETSQVQRRIPHA